MPGETTAIVVNYTDKNIPATVQRCGSAHGKPKTLVSIERFTQRKSRRRFKMARNVASAGFARKRLEKIR